ncbi:MAG: peptidoglycan recognition family protein [Massilimicrobiota sp.]|nr:peptidoglycan recognition family protein [Massilimicrobiota sp.]
MAKKKRINKKPMICMLVILLIIGIGTIYLSSRHHNDIEEYQVDGLSIQHQFLTVNPNSRSGKTLPRVNGIVIHYTANPGSTAQNNRDYFENLKITRTTSVSSHFIIGLEGEIIQCIPLNEVAYASNNRNKDTISIECCHPDESGQFNDATYQSLQKLVRALMDSYHLQNQDVIRHYDITGKICPKYFVDHEDQWQEFLNSL